jgi:hypothetical protein
MKDQGLAMDISKDGTSMYFSGKGLDVRNPFEMEAPGLQVHEVEQNENTNNNSNATPEVVGEE